MAAIIDAPATIIFPTPFIVSAPFCPQKLTYVRYPNMNVSPLRIRSGPRPLIISGSRNCDLASISYEYGGEKARETELMDTRFFFIFFEIYALFCLSVAIQAHQK